jgi:hypothetical protein
VPEAEDDLFASILAVSQMVFPGKYEGFRVSSIGITKGWDFHSLEIKRLLELWEDVERSSWWSLFSIAARRCDYEKLKVVHISCIAF